MVLGEHSARRAAASTEIDRETPGTVSEVVATSRTSRNFTPIPEHCQAMVSSVEPVSQPLPRTRRRQLEELDAAKVARIVGEAEPPSGAAGATAGGDGRRLRGIPAVARGTSGAMFGSDPLRALLAKEGQESGR
jgi:hypothetical protein